MLHKHVKDIEVVSDELAQQWRNKEPDLVIFRTYAHDIQCTPSLHSIHAFVEWNAHAPSTSNYFLDPDPTHGLWRRLRILQH